MEDIKCLKLVSGEELVAKVKELEDGMLELTSPVQIGLAPGGQLAMGAFMPFVKDDSEDRTVLTINKSHIMILADPLVELANTYNSKFGSGLVIPEGNTIGGLRLTD